MSGKARSFSSLIIWLHLHCMVTILACLLECTGRAIALPPTWALAFASAKYQIVFLSCLRPEVKQVMLFWCCWLQRHELCIRFSELALFFLTVQRQARHHFLWNSCYKLDNFTRIGKALPVEESFIPIALRTSESSRVEYLRRERICSH